MEFWEKRIIETSVLWNYILWIGLTEKICPTNSYIGEFFLNNFEGKRCDLCGTKYIEFVPELTHQTFKCPKFKCPGKNLIFHDGKLQIKYLGGFRWECWIEKGGAL